jgi:hypothetical protein
MRLSEFDRWRTMEYEAISPDNYEVGLDDMPDPCSVCEWVGMHEDECSNGSN